MKILVFIRFHKTNVEQHTAFEALNGNPGPKHCVLPHFLGGGGVGQGVGQGVGPSVRFGSVGKEGWG